ncbi:MAG: NGG1p interacting factor NIF3 [Alteromonadaceae bacterium]|nr:MAG: NGG1p interacting factor NIF3 [Alteromonadaceae bacterium]
MNKLVFFVPPSYLEQVKNALFDAGAGRYSNYDRCCWQVLGQGQFRPSNQARPYFGVSGALESLAEYRVEMLCDEASLERALDALKRAHPYEEPAYEVYDLSHWQV